MALTERGVGMDNSETIRPQRKSHIRRGLPVGQTLPPDIYPPSLEWTAGGGGVQGSSEPVGRVDGSPDPPTTGAKLLNT